MKRVILESPYAGDIERNVAYARECLHDSLKRGEAPIASHLLYPQVLSEETERQWGIDAGHAWLEAAEMMVLYVDYGISNGMHGAIKRAQEQRLAFRFRQIYPFSQDIVDFVYNAE